MADLWLIGADFYIIKMQEQKCVSKKNWTLTKLCKSTMLTSVLTWRVFLYISYNLLMKVKFDQCRAYTKQIKWGNKAVFFLNPTIFVVCCLNNNGFNFRHEASIFGEENNIDDINTSAQFVLISSTPKVCRINLLIDAAQHELHLQITFILCSWIRT